MRHRSEGTFDTGGSTRAGERQPRGPRPKSPPPGLKSWTRSGGKRSRHVPTTTRVLQTRNRDHFLARESFLPCRAVSSGGDGGPLVVASAFRRGGTASGSPRPGGFTASGEGSQQ